MDGASAIFTTDGLSTVERVDAYHDVVTRTFVPLDVEIDDASEFEAEIRTACVGPLALSRIKTRRHRVLRTRQLVRRTPATAFKVSVQFAGTSVVRQHDAEVVLHPGMCTMYDAGAEYSISLTDDVEMLVLQFDRDDLDAFIARPERALGIALDVRSGIGTCFRDLALSAGAAGGLSRDAERRLAEHVLELLSVSLRERMGESSGVGRRKADRFADACSWVEDHLGDPAANPAAMGHDLGMSVAYVHEVFQAFGTTPMAYLRDRRLATSRQALRNGGRSITSIALDHGFGSPSSFSRAFRERFGMSPRDVRRDRG